MIHNLIKTVTGHKMDQILLTICVFYVFFDVCCNVFCNGNNMYFVFFDICKWLEVQSLYYSSTHSFQHILSLSSLSMVTHSSSVQQPLVIRRTLVILSFWSLSATVLCPTHSDYVYCRRIPLSCCY